MNVHKSYHIPLLHTRYSYVLPCSSSSSSNQPEDLQKSPLGENEPINTNKVIEQKSLNLGGTSRITSLQWPQLLNITVYSSQEIYQSLNQTQNAILSFMDFIQKRGGENNPLIRNNQQLQKRDIIRLILRKAASLSLKDYEWRSSYFRTAEAERRVQESLARLMGEEYATYIRPADAPETKIGPLGQAEKQLVEWLGRVIEEEGQRARLIESSQGQLIRPIDLQSSGQGGPLSSLESSVVQFFNRIRMSERERVNAKLFRPKDLQEDRRGPLGDAEYIAVSAIEDIQKSEKLRMDISRARGGDVVRPIDVPGILGEIESFYIKVATAERQREKESEKKDGKVVRPMDSTFQGPLGEAERSVSNAVSKLRQEELDRLDSIKKTLADNRPMETNRNSFLGWTEAVFVGIVRAPAMVWMVIDRVMELMDSSRFDELDEEILRQQKMNSTLSEIHEDKV